MAIDGLFNIRPSNAADTVPEYITSVPKLEQIGRASC